MRHNARDPITLDEVPKMIAAWLGCAALTPLVALLFGGAIIVIATLFSWMFT